MTETKTYRMDVQNSSTGNTYELRIEGSENNWQGIWHTRASHGAIVDRLSGSLTGTDADMVFRTVKRIIEDADPAVIDVDWQFHNTPPWLEEDE